jgi:hypothetical protein
MSGIIFKNKSIFLAGFVMFAFSYILTAQTPDSSRYLKLTIGGGYGHYFNTFTNVSDQDVVNNKPSFSARLLWQPEYRLRLGLESGLYYIYSTTRIQTDGGSDKLTTNLKVIPIFLSLSMAVTKRFELNFSTGWTSMIYTIQINKSTKNKITGHTFSMSNFAAGCSYYIPLSRKIDLGAEIKYMYLGKTDDYHVSGMINFSYKIKTWKIH